MAKQHPDDSQKQKKPQPHDETEFSDADVVDADVAEAADAGSPKKTQLAGQSPLPTQLAKKSPQPTMLAPGASPPGASKGQDTPPQPPKLSLDDEEVVEAEAVDSGVVEVQPVSDVTMAQPASDAVEAQPASDVAEAMAVDDDDDVFADAGDADRSAPETPVRSEQAAEERGAAGRIDEDAVGDLPASRAESSVRVRGKRTDEPERTEAFDLDQQPPEEVDQTVAFDEAAEDESSAVDLGAKPYPKKGSSSHLGVDEVAEALESGVKLEAADSPMPHRPEPSVEFDELFEGGDAPSSMKNKRRDGVTEPDVVISKDAEEIAAADLLSEGAEAKSVEDQAADLWNEAGEPEAAEAKAEPTTPAPGKKSKAAAAAEEAAAAADEAPPPRKKKAGGGTAVMTRPAVKPKYGRRWVGGMLLGMLVGVGAMIGVRYYDPELLEQGFGMVAAPSPKQKAVSQPQQQQPQLTDAQRAHDAIDQGDYDAALQLLAAAPETAPNLTARAQAGWLKYLKDQAEKKADLNADDKVVKDVLDDLTKAKNDMMKAQVLKALEHKGLSDQVAGLKANEKALLDLRAALAKENIKAEVKDLPMAIGAALAAKKQADTLLQTIQKSLVDAQLLADDDKLDPAAIGKIVKDLGDKQAILTAVNKLLEDAKIKDSGAKGVGQLAAAKKDLDSRLAAVNKILADEKIKGDGAKGLQEVVKQRVQLQKDRDELDSAVKSAHKELVDAQFVPPGGDPRQQLLAGAKAARQRAESPLAIPLTQLAGALGSLGLNPVRDAKTTFESAALLAELNFYRLREPLIQAPEQKLDAYLAIYQDRSRTDIKEHAAALRDAAWVLSKEAKASATAKAKAHVVTGLILRNQEKYADAKKAFETALAAPVPNPGPWQAQAKQALNELTNPTAFYLPRIDQLQAGGQIKSAQEELAVALKVMPNDPRLLAQRALLRLDEFRGSGKIPADTQTAVRQDAAAALKSPPAAAEGAYVLGLLEEEIGNYDHAEKLYRQALKAHQGEPDDANRYRIALARVLQRERGPVFAPPAPKKEEKKAAEATEVSQAFPLALSLALAQAGDDEDDPGATARLKESIDLARDLIQSANPKIKGQGYMLLGQALARQGKRTEGVREYMKGMEMLFPGMASKEMAKLLEEHPAFQQPDAARAPSAYLAEVHFGKGLHLYWSRQYPEAEAHFKQALGFFGQDARYQYFMGLAQYAQKSQVKRDAAFFSFEQGARLEANNRPPVSEINASLERIQGDHRQLINGFRSKAIELRN